METYWDLFVRLKEQAPEDPKEFELFMLHEVHTRWRLKEISDSDFIKLMDEVVCW